MAASTPNHRIALAVHADGLAKRILVEENPLRDAIADHGNRAAEFDVPRTDIAAGGDVEIPTGEKILVRTRHPDVGIRAPVKITYPDAAPIERKADGRRLAHQQLEACSLPEINIAPVGKALPGIAEVDRRKFRELETVCPQHVQPALDRTAEPADHGHDANDRKYPHGDAQHGQRGPQLVGLERAQRETEGFD